MSVGGKTAIITGGARGIGRAIAEDMAKNGAKIAIIDQNQENINQCQSQFRDLGFQVLGFVGSVTQKDFLQDVFGEVDQTFGSIDILVNNAGITRDNLLKNISEDDWNVVLDVNLKGPFLCCQAAFPYLKQSNRGAVINIVSRSWLGNVGQTNYSASKGGLVSLTRTLALELARFQINVNGIAPGLIDTDMTRKIPSKVMDKLLKMQPTGKIGSVDDIARTAVFLASSPFITGQVIHVDGGKSCSSPFF